MLQMRQPRGMNIRLLGFRRAINDLLTVVDHARQRWAGHFRTRLVCLPAGKWRRPIARPCWPMKTASPYPG
jgi:hypothetical protein